MIFYNLGKTHKQIWQFGAFNFARRVLRELLDKFDSTVNTFVAFQSGVDQAVLDLILGQRKPILWYHQCCHSLLKKSIWRTILKIVIIISWHYTLSFQYKTAASFIFGLQWPIWNSAGFWHICLLQLINTWYTHIYIHKHFNGFLFNGFWYIIQTFGLTILYWVLQKRGGG